MHSLNKNKKTIVYLLANNESCSKHNLKTAVHPNATNLLISSFTRANYETVTNNCFVDNLLNNSQNSLKASDILIFAYNFCVESIFILLVLSGFLFEKNLLMLLLCNSPYSVDTSLLLAFYTESTEYVPVLKASWVNIWGKSETGQTMKLVSMFRF